MTATESPGAAEAPYQPSESDSPFTRVGGRERVEELVEHFYNAMERTEPALAKLHKLDSDGRVSRESRDRFALFLVGWLGGPQDYIRTHGHPRLRMRHAAVPVDYAMRDAWMRSMRIALDELGVRGAFRDWLDGRFLEVADFMRNVSG